MLIEHQNLHNRSLTVAVLGAPNVGKSSLINNLLGMDLSVVTHLPQTTRNKIKCIFTIDHSEIILVDTPGVHRSSKEINLRYNQQAREGTNGADLNLLLIDITKDLLAQIKDFKETFEIELGPTWMLFSKADLLPGYSEIPFEKVFNFGKELLPSLEKYFVISAKEGENIHLLNGALADKAIPGPHLFPGGEISDKPERFFACEYIREQAFLLLKDEVPYEIAVTIDEYKDLQDKNKKSKMASMISATIHVNRPSQRAIAVGTQGRMIKEIGTRARRKIEAMVGGQVQLNLHVKVSPHWFKNNFILEEIGIPRAPDSHRVWRQQ